jgi:hypothetical protein
MADYEVGYKKPPKKNQIKKGEVRNPNGARAHHKIAEGSMRKLSQREVEELGSALLQGDVSALKDIIDTREEKGRSVLMVWVASVAYRAIIKGEVGPLEVLLNRFVGRVSEKIDHTTNGNDIESGMLVKFVKSDTEKKNG